MLTREIISAFALLLLTVSARAEMVTTGSLSIVCTSHYAVNDAINAIVNKPASMKIAEVIEPLGCADADGGVTFIPTDSSFEAVLPGIIVMKDGKKYPVYVNEGGVKEKTQ